MCVWRVGNALISWPSERSGMLQAFPRLPVVANYIMFGIEGSRGSSWCVEDPCWIVQFLLGHLTPYFSWEVREPDAGLTLVEAMVSADVGDDVVRALIEQVGTV